jgi:hypothetical protein
MRHAEFPAVDDRARGVEPETGTEMIDGAIRRVLPADPPHADEQCNIAYVIRPDVAPGYTASTELLTRVDIGADFATDACIRKLGHDPETGSRYLEELSFEVKHTQGDADIMNRARKLIHRGVRRVFAIHVREDQDGLLHAGPVKEWLAGEDRWLELSPDAEIVDRCLMQPIKVQALLDATEADNQVARVLVAKDNPVIVEDKRKAVGKAVEEAVEERDVAHAQAMQERDQREKLRLQTMIVGFCDLLAIEVTAEQRARIEAMTAEELEALGLAIRTRRGWPEEL